MAKLPANWAAHDGSSTATLSGGGYVLQESGFKILLESGNGGASTDALIVEDIIMVPKETSVWDSL